MSSIPLTLGCQADSNCPQDYQCFNGECRSGPGKVLVNSLTIKTAECVNCGQEGVKVSLAGEVIGEFLDGVPCSTNTLDHASGLDFTTGGSARFDGKVDGAEDEIEKKKMGACFKVIFTKALKRLLLNDKNLCRLQSFSNQLYQFSLSIVSFLLKSL